MIAQLIEVLQNTEENIMTIYTRHRYDLWWFYKEHDENKS